MHPLWAYGYIQSKERYESADDLITTIKTFRDKNIPLDCIVLDWQSWEDGQWGQKSFDANRFPDPSIMMKTIHDLDARFDGQYLAQYESWL
jgi:alpha-D-xyloside xylohydrolase